MDCKELAARAEQELFGDPNKKLFKDAERFALQGYFRGVAQGNITVGQSWVAQILSKEDRLGISDYAGIATDIFASGMCCDGQSLTTARTANRSR